MILKGSPFGTCVILVIGIPINCANCPGNYHHHCIQNSIYGGNSVNTYNRNLPGNSISRGNFGSNYGADKKSMLKTIRNDISNATYDARCCCIYDGPLGPAVTPKERRNRRLALLVFFICAFVAILVLSINQVQGFSLKLS